MFVAIFSLYKKKKNQVNYLVKLYFLPTEFLKNKILLYLSNLIKPPRVPLGEVSFITREQITLMRVKPDEFASCLSSINFLDNQASLIPSSN